MCVKTRVLAHFTPSWGSLHLNLISSVTVLLKVGGLGHQMCYGDVAYSTCHTHATHGY